MENKHLIKAYAKLTFGVLGALTAAVLIGALIAKFVTYVILKP